MMKSPRARTTCALWARHVTVLLAAALAACGADDSHDDDLAEAEHHAEAWAQAYRDAEKAANVALLPPDAAPRKVVFLTFDDGPKPGPTDLIVEVLRRREIPATFFMNGAAINRSAASRALAQQIADDPLFLAANHSYSHKNMRAMPAATRDTEIGRVTEQLAAMGEVPRFFRFPYGAASAAGIAQAIGEGYNVTGWHVDSGDWCYAAGGGRCKPSTWDGVPDRFRDDMQGYVLSQLPNGRGGIILFHDIHGYTASTVEAIIDELEARGYAFGRLDDDALLPRLNAMAPPPAGPTPFIGDACVADAQCSYAGGTCMLGVCTQLCEGFCPDRPGRAATFCATHNDYGTPLGYCVPKADGPASCQMPLTFAADVPRFLGASAATAKLANVCALPLPSE